MTVCHGKISKYWSESYAVEFESSTIIWVYRRIFMTDTNQNKISMGCSPTTRIPNANVTSLPTAAISHQVTSPTLDIDISSLGITNMAAFWPTSIIVLLDTGSGATDEGTKHADAQLRTATGSGTGVATTDTTNYIGK